MDPVTPRTRIVLVDDQDLVRAGIRLIVGGAPDLEIVGEAADGLDAIAVVERTEPDVVLMDIRMPRADGIVATSAIRAHRPGVRIVMLTTFDDEALVLQALRAGAVGYLVKDTPPAALVDEVRRAASGGMSLSAAAVERLVRAADGAGGEAASAAHAEERAAAELVATLTERERDVAGLMGDGLSNADIGARLYLGLATVKTHAARVFDKLGAENRVQVALTVQLARRAGR